MVGKFKIFSLVYSFIINCIDYKEDSFIDFNFYQFDPVRCLSQSMERVGVSHVSKVFVHNLENLKRNNKTINKSD